MNKTESTIISIATAVLCPLLLFVLFWWSAAALNMVNIWPIPESGIPAAALTSLVLGIILDVLYLKKWVAKFYCVNIRLMALVYLGCSVIAVAMFMGLPVGNLVLGTFVGVYIGRRAYHTEMDREAFSKVVKKASLFTAVVTGVEALPIGLLALNEDWVDEWLQRVTDMTASNTSGLPGIGLILVLCVILMLVQYSGTKVLAGIAYRFDGSQLMN